MKQLHAWIRTFFEKYIKEDEHSTFYDNKVHLILFYWTIQSSIIAILFISFNWNGIFTILMQTSVCYSMLSSAIIGHYSRKRMLKLRVELNELYSE